jgi:choline-glycine betaine transporter
LNQPLRSRDRVVAKFLLAMMTAGSLILWLGIPVFGLWAISKVTSSPGNHLLVAVLVIPMVMLAFAPALFWVNRLYLQVVGIVGDEDDDEEDERRRVRGPLEPILLVSLAIAATGLVVWILILAPNSPQLQVV